MKRRTAVVGLATCLVVLAVVAVTSVRGLDAGPSPDAGIVPTERVAAEPPTTDEPSAVAAAFAEAGVASGRVEDVFSPEASPISLIIGDIEIASPVIDVGIDAQGLMEVPGAGQIGWYRPGPAPGELGSSVLAAHVDFDGRPGVFARLAQVDPGSVVAVGFDDGTFDYFEIVGRRQYGKAELPVAEIFATDGTVPLLTLVTCGGAFDPSSESYSDNLVAYAVPLDT